MPADSKNLLQLTQPLVLVGMMGAGKSTVGRRLARQLEMPFIDSDAAIEEASGMQVSDIFAEYGEEYFRKMEATIIKRMLDDAPQVIAIGGGAYVQQGLRRAINKQAISIWLDAPLDVLVERVSRRDTRPLLKGKDKRAVLSDLIDKRESAYKKAHLRVESNAGAHSTVITRIIDQLCDYLAEQKGKK